MAEEEQPDRYTFGLLVDLRDICRKIGNEHHRMASELATSCGRFKIRMCTGSTRN